MVYCLLYSVLDQDLIVNVLVDVGGPSKDSLASLVLGDVDGDGEAVVVAEQDVVGCLSNVGGKWDEGW